MEVVRILVLSFLFKGESFSFVRGLWFLDLDNRKTLLVEIFGSPLHQVFLDGDWQIYCFLAFGYLLWDLYIFGKHCLVYRRATSTWAFLQGLPNSLGLDAFCIRGFSLLSMRSMISSCYFSVAFVLFSWRSKPNMVDVCCAGERAQWLPWAKHWTYNFIKSSQIDRDSIDHHHQGIYKVFQVRSTG